MLFSEKKNLAGGKIYVPSYIRAALALNDGCPLHATVFSEDSLGLSEINLTPVPPAAWQDTWRLQATIKNEPGVLSALTVLLGEHDIDIILSRGVTIQRDRTFQLDLHLDLSRYSSTLDGTPEARKQNPLRPVRELKAEIALTLLERLEFVTPNKPMLSLHRNLALHRAYQQMERRYAVSLKNGCIDLATVISNEIAPGSGARRRYYVVADEDNAVVRAYVIQPGCGFIHCRVVMENQVGALGRVASALTQYGLNIYQFFAREGGAQRGCIIDLIVRKEQEMHEIPSWPVIRRDIERAIAQAGGRNGESSVKILEGTTPNEPPAEVWSHDEVS